MLKEQTVTVKWSPRTKTKYLQYGYEFTNMWDDLEIDVKHLGKGSHTKVIVTCDFCGCDFLVKHSDYSRWHSKEYGDACKKCRPQKQKLQFLDLYGVEYYTQTDKFKEQRVDTMMDKYGDTHWSRIEQCREKFKQTSFEHYGTEHPMKSTEVKHKALNAQREKYDGKLYIETEEFRERSKKTCMEKYGYECTANVPEIRWKQMQTKIENGTLLTSYAERESVKLLKEIYGEDNCVPSYHTEYYILDCLLNIDGNLIDFEYDGIWCHDEVKDSRRDRFHIDMGMKIFRVKDGYKIPSREQLIEGVNHLLNTDDDYYEIIL